MRAILISLLMILATLVSACARGQQPFSTPTQPSSSSTSQAATTANPFSVVVPPVPAEFQSLYNELDSALTAFDQSFNASGNAPVIFGAELLAANGNRGTALLEPQTMSGVRTNLDALQKMGAQGVTIAIKYPMLTTDFPNSAQYLEFFKSVAAEVRKRNLKMDIEVGVIFPPPFSSLNVNYKGLTLDQYKVKNRQMVATIINEIKPDYLNLGSEPDTEAAITGIRELNNPQVYTDLINYTLKDLPRGNTKIGAGLGTWNTLDFVKSEAANTSVDFISLHVYPVTGKALQTAVAAADLAHQYNKRVILDEMWLYKNSANEPPTSIAANAEIFRRDTSSFWMPLDQKFLAVMAKLARAKNIEYVSAFWATNFFAYLDYDPKLQTIPYNALVTQLNTEAARNMLAGKLSPTGEFYKQLSEKAGTPTGTTITVFVTANKRDVTYCTPNGIPQKMDLTYPKTIGDKPLPVTVYIHGGGWTSGNKGNGAGTADMQELLARGYVVVSLDYRLAPKYPWPAQIIDVKCAIRHLRANAATYKIDPNKIGVWGGSAGGHLASMLGTTDQSAGFDVGEYSDQSSRVQAVVDLFGPADLTTLISERQQAVGRTVFGATSRDDPILVKASPITYISSDDPPFLILQGDKDQTVPMQQSQILYDKLKQGGVTATLVIVKNAGHGFTPQGGAINPSRGELTKMIADFFDKYLR